MYITYRAREKLRAFTCTCGAREAQLAARDVHLSLHACIDASAHARHTHTHVRMYCTLACMIVRVSHVYMSYMHVNQTYNRHVHVRKVERIHVYVHVYLSLTTPEDAL